MKTNLNLAIKCVHSLFMVHLDGTTSVCSFACFFAGYKLQAVFDHFDRRHLPTYGGHWFLNLLIKRQF